ncbi:MAG TPA: GAF domain-containing protein [Vicinamibacterales bacterium]|nr:GAF domain-containing protein [Vicinamibacterales bacterium]
MLEQIRWCGRLTIRLLDVRSEREREKRAAYAFALLLVALVAAVKDVTGVTVNDAPFTLYAFAIAASAAWGGFTPALVTTLASLLVGGLGAAPPVTTESQLLFGAEGLSLAVIVWVFRSRIQAREARLDAAQATIAALKAQGREGHLLDTARRREWDEYRHAAALAQAALQQAADDARQQLAAIESLTDPSLNPLGGASMVTELLERLRACVRADGAALVQPGRVGTAVVAARGLQPAAGQAGAESLQLTPGRVAVVHNDPDRVEQLSSLRWPADVASLLVVPVVHDGEVWSTIEVVSERSRQVSDWDVALARVVADRLAAVVVENRRLAAKAS